MKNWPRWLFLAISLIPVLALASIVVDMFVQALPALSQVGIGRLFVTDLAPPMSRAARVQYGMLTPMWGTFMVALIAMLIALPSAVCMAIVAREFHVPVLSQSMTGIVGVLGGIPPVIYATMSIFFVESFMRPKLTAWDVPDERSKALIQGLPQFALRDLPAQLPNSTVLAGFLIGLLIIPFMAPLVDDAFRGVPVDMKQGSYALGATRWQTLWWIVLPHAAPGIVAAVSLGTLVGIGEILIPSFVLGGAENPVTLAKPIWNVLAHTPTLSSVGASLHGALTLGEVEGISRIEISMAYVSSLFLLAFACLVIGGEALVQRQLRRARK